MVGLTRSFAALCKLLFLEELLSQFGCLQRQLVGHMRMVAKSYVDVFHQIE